MGALFAPLAPPGFCRLGFALPPHEACWEEGFASRATVLFSACSEILALSGFSWPSVMRLSAILGPAEWKP